MSEYLNKIKLSHSELELREDGLVQVTASNHTYQVSEIKEIHAAMDELTQGKKALLLLVADDFTNITSDARTFLSSPEAANHSIAEAYVIKSLAQRLIMNFITKVAGTVVPVKFFTEFKLAVEWLETFKNKS